MELSTTPGGILEIAALADLLKTPIELLRENEKDLTSLTSFGIYLPSSGALDVKTEPIYLVLEHDHFSPIITKECCLWPDQGQRYPQTTLADQHTSISFKIDLSLSNPSEQMDPSLKEDPLPRGPLHNLATAITRQTNLSPI